MTRHLCLARAVSMLLLAGCSSTAPAGAERPANVAPPAPRYPGGGGSYTALALRAAVAHDLEIHAPDEAYDALKKMVFDAQVEGRSTVVNALWSEAGVETSFLAEGAVNYLTAVKELGRILAGNCGGELDAVYAASDSGDLATIRRSLEVQGGTLHEETVALVPALGPHRGFFEGVLAYGELTQQPVPSRELAEEVVQRMQTARLRFARMGLAEQAFSALGYSAQALELIGENDRAIEFWLQAASDAYWSSAPPQLQVIIGARVERYSKRLESEIRTRADREWQSRYSEALARIASLKGDVEAKSVEIRDLTKALVQQEGTISSQQDAIRSYQAMQGATRRGSDSALGTALDVVGTLADFVTVGGLLGRGLL